MKYISLQSKSQRGFTLIEIMVATSIFMMIMLMAMGMLITSSDSAKRSQALRSAMDNVNFALESMTRSLRQGKDYLCVTNGSSVSLPAGANGDCATGGAAIVFTAAKPNDVPARNAAYRRILRADGTGVLQRCIPGCVDLVSPDVDVQTLTFFVNGTNTSDKIQPSIYILMKGVVTIKSEATVFAVQTEVSQRSGE